MQILLNDKNEIISYAIVGGIEGGIEVEIPEEILGGNPISYKYEKGKFSKITNYGLEDLKHSKLSELAIACRATIYAGVDVKLPNGVEHFTLNADDQDNIPVLASKVANGASAVPYHSAGNYCRLYSAEEFTLITQTVEQFKTYHTTYCNFLNNYVKSLESVDEVEAVYYGMELPPDIKAQFDELMAVTANA